ncbi:MAG: DEAD/DEAH box helicase [Spirochaetaceae bacterium]|nr:DEAD/DEAH box helicase [Spirochaetaceae bacterium]
MHPLDILRLDTLAQSLVKTIMLEAHRSKSFALLDERVQRWIWRNEWTELHDVQEQSIPLILAHEHDVLLCAAMASGKTEAAFLPVLSSMLSQKNGLGLTIYISPLAALINDQFSRLTGLCENLEVPVHPWHGGISPSIKKDFFGNPCGVLLITPESLEAMFCNHGYEIPQLLHGTEYIVIDELHSFIGNERGKQLQTLLSLAEERTEKNIPRLGLSATLGDVELAADFLSGEDRNKRPCDIIVSESNQHKIKLLLKGITEAPQALSAHAEQLPQSEQAVPQALSALPLGTEGRFDHLGANENTNGDGGGEKSFTFSAVETIAEYLFEKLRGTNSLVFPNTRSKVELFTHLLSSYCEKNGLRNEFFAHHGNLSKEIRKDAEEALRSKEKSATVICTNTLELGIDIGEVESVVQIEPPPSVSSLRQRLGRSGRRRGQAAVLRAFSIEKAQNPGNHPFSQLRERTFDLCACIMLMLEGWCEPPSPGGLHLSTLVQQILALIAECNGLLPEAAYNSLCVRGPFQLIDKKDFYILVKALIAQELVEQDARGTLLLGTLGEKRVNHFSFYAAFESQTEYRIVAQDKTLGTLPINSTMQIHDIIIFAGKTWRIQNINDKNRTIEVSFFGEGKAPVFTGSGWSTHTIVRARMKELYASNKEVSFADSNARRLIDEGRTVFSEYALNKRNNFIIEKNKYAVLFTWLGDRANRTLQLLFRHHKIASYTGGLGLTIPGKSGAEIADFLHELQETEIPPLETLLDKSQNLFVGKWDWVLPPRLLKKNYASLYLDLQSAREWLAAIVTTQAP